MNEFEKLVYSMRFAQRQWFKSHENRFLAESKRLEAEVDKHLREKMEAERQPSLFSTGN
ncbi:MAG: hypothetical protein J5654_09555 [Victivallales bacterium]|nr:hypothetical protein [Victivallales bacterium]